MIYKLKGVDRNKMNKICEDFSLLLEDLGYKNVDNALSYVIRELIHNAIKANIKRMFYKKQKGLAEDKKIEEFKKALHNDLDSLLKELDGSDSYVVVKLINDSESILVSIQYDSDMLPEEIKSVDHILNSAYKKNLLSTKKNDNRYYESAGLGLYSIFKIMHNIGVSLDKISYSTGNGSTAFELLIEKKDLSG